MKNGKRKLIKILWSCSPLRSRRSVFQILAPLNLKDPCYSVVLASGRRSKSLWRVLYVILMLIAMWWWICRAWSIREKNYFSVSDKCGLEWKPMTSWFLVQMLYHWATGDLLGRTQEFSWKEEVPLRNGVTDCRRKQTSFILQGIGCRDEF